MNINMLEYLAAIEQYGSLSEAARHLYVSQPYLSRLVRQAEQEYGLTIFTRGREGLCPTEQGRLFLQMARDLAAQAQHSLLLPLGIHGHRLVGRTRTIAAQQHKGKAVAA